MTDSLKHLIDRLKRTKTIASQPIHFETLSSIDKFADNDFYKAYLLGHFFRYKLDSDNLSADDKTFLIETIKSNNLEAYYYLKTKPDDDIFGTLIYLFILVGLVAIIAGTIQLSNGYFWYGLGTKYLVPIIREGGYKIILGLVFFVGGLIRLRHEIKKKRFLNSFLTSTNNSN
ncbi:hypothetical protein KJS94_02900 [Flavihumibacter rivuli]|uniref:hypothetical protein n=1 Tax=Flavihumibacter rivuli TaxID=2838156 RepID=UPI001BDF26D0|nr:hypothetical protein [Flavihumibacter rivuli]ULQ57145.1 hypothetical protein KJS94_02900 [Flavihumibacter rivuli]